MKKINDKTLLETMIKENNIHQILEQDVLDYAELHYYDKGEQILQSEQPLTYYYFFITGKIKVFSHLENGKSLLLRFYTTMDTLGEVELFSNTPIRCNVEAVEPSYLIALPAEILREKCTSNPIFLSFMIQSLSTKLTSISSNSAYNLLYPLINRLASYLYEHKTASNEVVLTSSFEDIADFLGTTYRHLHRTLENLVKKGILQYEGKKITLLDVDALKKLSKNIYR